MANRGFFRSQRPLADDFRLIAVDLHTPEGVEIVRRIAELRALAGAR